MAIHINGWFRPSASPTRLIVRSRSYELLTHYAKGFGSVRCQVAGCELCSLAGEPKRTLVYVVERAGALFLLELNCDAIERELVCGDEIVISRRKMADFQETFLRRDGFVGTAEVWPANYLAAIGQKGYERACHALGNDAVGFD